MQIDRKEAAAVCPHQRQEVSVKHTPETFHQRVLRVTIDCTHSPQKYISQHISIDLKKNCADKFKEVTMTQKLTVMC